MSLFRVRDNTFSKVESSDWPERLTGPVVEELASGGSLLPERLLVIDDWAAPEPTSGLLALDAKGSLVVIVLAGHAPEREVIGKAASYAWRLRHVDYAGLAAACAAYQERRGCDCGGLAAFHAGYFSLESPLDASLFNQNQRLLMLAPGFSEAALDAMRWRSLEMTINAYALSFIDVEHDVSLVRVEPIDLIGAGRLATLLSLILRAPAIAIERRMQAALPAPHDENAAGRAPARAPAKQVRHAATESSSTLHYAVLGAMVLLYIATFSFLTLRHHANFGTYGFDLGIFDQGMWLLSQFKSPFITVRGLNLFGDHLSLILVPLSPLYRIWADARLLLILQTVALAIGAIPIYLLARERLKSGVLALALAASYLLYPALQWINRDHFHPEALATPALLFAFYAAAKRRYALFALAVLAAVLTKEDVALIVAFMGIYLAVTNNRTVGLATSAIAATWFFASMKLVFPAFNPEGFFYVRNFSGLGSGLGEVVITTITQPGLVVSILAQQQKLTYVLQILAPVAFSPLASIEVFLIAMPALFSNLVSAQGYMDTIEYHYTATIIPFVFISAILAIEKLALKTKEATLVAVLIIAVAVTSNVFWSPSPISQKFGQGVWASENHRRPAIEAALASIPKNAVVSAYYAFVPHLTHREKIYEFPNPYRTLNWGVRGENPADTNSIQYIIVDYGRLPGDQQTLVDTLRNTEFTQVYGEEGIVVLRKE